MKELFIIDGYNFIFNFLRPKTGKIIIKPENLENLRDKLINDLAQYKNYNSCEMIVVFDAKHGSSTKHGREMQDSVVIIYSKKGETADTIVEKLVHSSEGYNNIFVVTSDYMQQKVIFKKNIYRKSIREFALELHEFKKKLTGKIYENSRNNEKSFYTLEKRLDSQTRKKLEEFRKS